MYTRLERSLCGAIALLLLTIPSCSDSQKDARLSEKDLIERTKGQLHRLASRRRSGGVWSDKYLTPAFESGLSVLNEAEAIPDPQLLAAGFFLHRGVLFLSFLDGRFQARGIIIENEAGYKGTFPGLWTWSPEDREWFAETILRDATIAYAWNGEVRPGEFFPWEGPEIDLPPEVLEHNPRVSLLLEDGTRTPFVTAYVGRPYEGAKPTSEHRLFDAIRAGPNPSEDVRRPENMAAEQ